MISISNNGGSVLKKLISIISILVAFSASASLPYKCNLRPDETVNIALDFFEENRGQLLEWADEDLLPYLINNVQDDGFYKEDQNKFYFPLFTIREEYIRGSMWIEVTCDGVATFGQYFEEV